MLPVLEEGQDLVQRCRLSVELGNCPFRQQEQVLAFVVDRLPLFRFGAMDAGGNGAALAEFAADKYGTTRIEQIKLSEAFYMGEMPRFKAAFEDGTLDALPRDDQCRDDLRAIRKVNGVPKLPSTATQRAGASGSGGADQAKQQRHGDFAIGLFLAYYAMRQEGMPGCCEGFESVPRRGGGGEDFEEDWGHSSRHML